MEVSQNENNTFVIAKTNQEKRQVFGWANVAVRANGETICDWQEDMVDTAELEQAAYEFVDFLEKRSCKA